MGFGSLLTLGEAYRAAGQTEQMKATLRRAEDMAIAQVSAAAGARDQAALQRAYQFVQYLQTTYLLADEPQAAADFSARFATAIGDPREQRSVEELRAAAANVRRQRDSVAAGN